MQMDHNCTVKNFDFDIIPVSEIQTGQIPWDHRLGSAFFLLFRRVKVFLPKLD